MPSPSRPPRGSPSRRAALHERSESHTNERSFPTVRMVRDSQAAIYDSTPYPTKPSQVLWPENAYAGPGPTFERDSHAQSPGNTSRYDTKDQRDVANAKGKGTARREDDDTGRGARRHSPDISFYTDSTYDSISDVAPNPDRNNTFFEDDQAKSGKGRMSDDIVHLPSVPPRADSSGFTPASAHPFQNPGHQPLNKGSNTSLSSINSSGTVVVKKTRDGRRRASYSAFPNSSQSNLTISTPLKQIRGASDETSTPVSPVSPSSPVFSQVATPNERRISSVPTYAKFPGPDNSPVNLQYPVIKPPSASGSWAQSSTTSPRRPPKALERQGDRWNPHLSTVQSEATGSHSEEGNLQSVWSPDSSRASKSSSNMRNPRTSSEMPPLPTESPDFPPPPVPPFARQRDTTGSTIRVVNEQQDEVSNLPYTTPRSRGSDRLVVPGDIPGGAAANRPGSRASFFKDSIPAWAKAYYARPTSSLSTKSQPLNRPTTSVGNSSLNVFRTRNRPDNPAQRRSSRGIFSSRPEEPDLAEVRGSPRRRASPSWSPHLWHDRMSLGRHRTIFQAPSLDEQAEGAALSKRNAQIVLFATGFIFPISWFIASVLPLPTRPAPSRAKGKNAPHQAQIAEDLEKQLGPTDEARYENARWWRNINRIMSLVGILIIVAIIVLAVVATR